MADRKMLMLDEPMTLEDCDFLRSVYLPCEKDSAKLDLRSLSTEEIQEFGIVFKVLDGKNTFKISFSLRNPNILCLPHDLARIHRNY